MEQVAVVQLQLAAALIKVTGKSVPEYVVPPLSAALTVMLTKPEEEPEPQSEVAIVTQAS